MAHIVSSVYLLLLCAVRFYVSCVFCSVVSRLYIVVCCVLCGVLRVGIV